MTKNSFPRRYAESVSAHQGKLPVTVESVTGFCRSLRDRGIPAWQRLQAARAVEAYRDLVLGTGEPSLAAIRQVLQRRAEQERNGEPDQTAGASRPGVRDERHLVGVIDPNEPAVLQEMRRQPRSAALGCRERPKLPSAQRANGSSSNRSETVAKGEV